MLSTRLVRRLKVVALMASLAAAATMSGVGCSLTDIRDNIVAGSLDFVSDTANSFWANLFAAGGA